MKSRQVWLTRNAKRIHHVGLDDKNEMLAELARCAIKLEKVTSELGITRMELVNVRQVLSDEMEMERAEAHRDASMELEDVLNNGEGDSDGEW